MNIFNYIMIGCTVFSILVVLFFALRTRKFFKTLLTSALLGITTLLILHFTSNLTGFKLEITPYTLSASSFLGLPGVVAIVLCKMIFGFS